MIPKKIHYVWVGGKDMPKMAQTCLQSWKKKLPDFEIIRWDETNSPMTAPYVQHMYQAKKWAFVSDYIRFWVLAKEGGVYLDTDSLVLKHFGPELTDSTEFDTFFSKMQDGYIGCGVIGAKANDPFIKAILADYETTDPNMFETCPQVVTRMYNVLKPSHVKLFDTRYLNPCTQEERRTPEKLKDAYVDNLYAASWVRFGKLKKFARPILSKLEVLSIVKRIYNTIFRKN